MKEGYTPKKIWISI